MLSELPDKNSSYEIVEKGMLMASTEGSARQFLEGLPYGVASKTGTAQVADGYYNATMMAYGPVENPEIAVAIVAEKAGNGYYLAETVRGIFEEYFRLKELRQNPDWRDMLEAEENAVETETDETVSGDTAEPIAVQESIENNAGEQPADNQTAAP